MTVDFFPFGDPKADRNDACRLCDTVGGLTRTHVPSRAAGNRERGRPLGERVKPDGSRTLEFGKRPPGAGWWGWYFCDPATGPRGSGRRSTFVGSGRLSRVSIHKAVLLGYFLHWS
jgi:hypothetical protein